MNTEPEFPDDIEMLPEPLFTEDGFINEAGFKGLENAINNIPPAYERLKDDIEWSTTSIWGYHDLVGAFCCGAIQCLAATKRTDHVPPCLPPNLEKIANFLGACLLKDVDEFGFVRWSLCDINRKFHEILLDDSPLGLFMEWNNKDGILGEDWLDLHAVLQNVCIILRAQLRDDANSGLFSEKEVWSLAAVNSRKLRIV